MNSTHKEIKRDARLLLKAPVKPSPFTVALVFTIITVAISFLLSRISGSSVVVDNEKMAALQAQAQAGNMPSYSEFTEALEIVKPKSDAFSEFLDLALQALNILLAAGFSLYALRFTTAQGGETGNLLDGFSQFYRIIMVYLLKTLAISAGLFCFIIPGVRLFYGYRQAVYLLWEHPEWSPIQCLHYSRLVMTGKKSKLFLMDLSFLGWILLGSAPFTLAGFCLDQKMYGSLIAALLGGIAFSSYGSVYMEVSTALFYRRYCTAHVWE